MGLVPFSGFDVSAPGFLDMETGHGEQGLVLPPPRFTPPSFYSTRNKKKGLDSIFFFPRFHRCSLYLTSSKGIRWKKIRRWCQAPLANERRARRNHDPDDDDDDDGRASGGGDDDDREKK